MVYPVEFALGMHGDGLERLAKRATVSGHAAAAEANRKARWRQRILIVAGVALVLVSLLLIARP